MTNEERVEKLHRRMNDIRMRRERRITTTLGVASFSLIACLLTMMVRAQGVQTGSMADMYAGSTMLFSNAGGYVLFALVAFTAGVLVAVLCMRIHKQNGEDSV